jgi:alginate O-acetyltransferase complex protein AlgI
MLFSSYPFVLVFLPATYLIVLFADRTGGVRAATAVLLAASLAFYAMWDFAFLFLLLGSIATNFLAAHWIAAARTGSARLPMAVAANLALLGFYKYAGFLTANVEALLALRLDVPAVLLPLGISFFTFEQIAYLVDVRRGTPPERNPVRYGLFVAFFPRLVAGPILRFSELMPQLPATGRLRINAQDAAVGLTIFAIGLAKKTLLADGVAPYANEGFAAAASGPVDLFVAWGAVLAYTMQLYFDFSGYSDMAIGIARLFGLRFPQNFASPYRACGIVEFWRRWHITLSRFLRDYLYIALGGNRRGVLRRYSNLMLTMVLGGLWHGASWSFVAWGALHGTYLLINHAWRTLRGPASTTWPARVGAWTLTMLAVMVAWVFFRATDLGTAFGMLAGMAGQHGASLPAGLVEAAPGMDRIAAAFGIGVAEGSGSRFVGTWAWGLGLALGAVLLPNTQQIMARWQPVLETVPPPFGWARHLAWKPNAIWATWLALVSLLGLLAIGRGGEFLYWQF